MDESAYRIFYRLKPGVTGAAALEVHKILLQAVVQVGDYSCVCNVVHMQLIVTLTPLP